jgi:hypothetical protein
MVIIKHITTGDVQLDQIQGSTRDAVNDVDTSKPFGTPTTIVSANYTAKFGEIVLCDPTKGQITISLPKSSKKDIGKHVIVKNLSASVNRIYIKDNSGVVDLQTSVYMAGGYESQIWVCYDVSKWVKVAVCF